MAFGVDLGTTNSSIAWADGAGDVHSLRVRRGLKDPFDSVERSMVLDPLGDPRVGQQARTEAANRPEAPLLTSFKRRFNKQRLRQWRLSLVDVPTNDYDPVQQGIRVSQHIEKKALYDEYSRDEVVSAGGLVFERLLTSTEVDVGAPGRPTPRHPVDLITSAFDAKSTEHFYVGVPVLFGPTGRRRMLAALVESGCFGPRPEAYGRVLRRCRLVYEPLALISDLALFEPQTVVVFDYGGGTLDIAVLDVEFGVDQTQIVRELSLGGHARAGDALDAAFRNNLLDSRPSFKKAYERQIASGSEFDRWRADDAFANTKIRLSTADAATIPLFDEEVTRDELERAISPEVDLALEALGDALARGNVAPRAVGTVLLTGGSSLIPLVQRRLREVFPSLDEVSFVAHGPDTEVGRLTALTGVSRGLARFGFMEGFEETAPCDFSIVVPGVPGKVVCLPRGSNDVRSLSRSPATTVPVAAHLQMFALYSDLVREAFCGALADVELPPRTTAVKIRVSASRERFMPAFAVYVEGNRRPVASFDLEAMSVDELAEFVEGDYEWLPVGSEPNAPVLTQRVAVGDFVAWVWNGSMRRGQVLAIRDVGSGREVTEIAGFDPGPYLLKIARELNGRVVFGQVFERPLAIGELRLD
jgi:hypothetical protein